MMTFSGGWVFDSLPWFSNGLSIFLAHQRNTEVPVRQIPKQTLKLDIHILNRLTAYYVWSEFDDAAMAAPYLYVDVTIF